MLWEELRAEQFEDARAESKGVCVIPFGVIEKHGSHLPLGTDMIIAREVAMRAAKLEPVVIFPYYYFGQIAEARHVPGTISVSSQLMISVLTEICKEISRNGFKKIVILNSHGGNNAFIPFFIQSTLNERKDYIVYSVEQSPLPEDGAKLSELFAGIDMGEHAGNLETSMIMAARPELIDMSEVKEDDYVNHGQLNHLTGIYTAIWWYAEHPAHAAGQPYDASKEIGDQLLDFLAKAAANRIKMIKEDTMARHLQNEFFDKVDKLKK